MDSLCMYEAVWHVRAVAMHSCRKDSQDGLGADDIGMTAGSRYKPWPGAGNPSFAF